MESNPQNQTPAVGFKPKPGTIMLTPVAPLSEEQLIANAQRDAVILQQKHDSLDITVNIDRQITYLTAMKDAIKPQALERVIEHTENNGKTFHVLGAKVTLSEKIEAEYDFASDQEWTELNAQVADLEGKLKAAKEKRSSKEKLLKLKLPAINPNPKKNFSISLKS